MSAKKFVVCPKCKGRGRTLVMSNGTVVDSYICYECDGRKRVPKPRQVYEANQEKAK